MKKILLFTLLLSVGALQAQTVIRKDGGTTTAPQTRGYVDQSLLGSGNLILGVAFNFYLLEEFDPMGTYDYESALILAPEVSAEYGLGWDFFKFKAVAGPGWDGLYGEGLNAFHAGLGARVDWQGIRYSSVGFQVMKEFFMGAAPANGWSFCVTQTTDMFNGISAEFYAGMGLVNVQDWEDAYLLKFGGQLNFGGY